MWSRSGLHQIAADLFLPAARDDLHVALIRGQVRRNNEAVLRRPTFDYGADLRRPALAPRVLGLRRPHRQVDRTHTGVDAKRHRLRCGPDKRPIGGRDSDAEAMTGGKAVGYIV